ncbi:YLR456W-like protein [Saccharomyces cerevisiae x Saccharomyces kudriavzevii VIN7]|uniref:YLR456W-like protein n=1 Tax=Saccharomyces cerevisiae x Saccharomyces kudriavzevii (strain VIN7) TaxID=1095631 RepID=H0GYT8_SACCK|nr:YLR456W-like protein [Saccharomyces cerevisiae x Saccharomyces kudriavzevii VIN7]
MKLKEQIPKDLLHLIKRSKYVHVATCSSNCIPSVSLMHYIFVSASEIFDKQKGSIDTDHNDYIIFTVFEESVTFSNVIGNPNVALLFHDWITAKNLTLRKKSIHSENCPIVQSESTRLNDFLGDFNQSELNQMSATANGIADIVDPDSEESTYYRRLLLTANPDADIFILGEDTAIIKVTIQKIKVSDMENNTSVYGQTEQPV